MAITTAEAASLAGAGILALVGLVVAARGYRRFEPELRRLRSDPLPVRDAPRTASPAEFRGQVEIEERYVRAPFTGADCVAVEWEVEEYVSSGKNSYWKTLASGEQSVPFRLADETGSILVEPAGAAVALSSGWDTEVGREETAQGRIREFLDELDVEPGEGGEVSLGPISMGTGDRRRYVESRLDVGETVSVFGRPERDDDAGGDWGSDAVAAAVRETDDAPFVVADSPAVPFFRRSTFVALGILGAGAALALYGAASALSVLPTVL